MTMENVSSKITNGVILLQVIPQHLKLNFQVSKEYVSVLISHMILHTYIVLIPMQIYLPLLQRRPTKVVFKVREP